MFLGGKVCAAVLEKMQLIKKKIQLIWRDSFFQYLEKMNLKDAFGTDEVRRTKKTGEMLTMKIFGNENIWQG